MKKLLSVIIILVMVMSSMLTVSAAELNIETLGEGTYKVSVENGTENGFFLVEDAGQNLVDFVIVEGKSYGYIFIDRTFSNLTYTSKNVKVELVSTDDLGFSGYHVFELVEGDRDYDPILDKIENKEINVDLNKFTSEEINDLFS